jgi:hypothetical protein
MGAMSVQAVFCTPPTFQPNRQHKVGWPEAMSAPLVSTEVQSAAADAVAVRRCHSMVAAGPSWRCEPCKVQTQFGGVQVQQRQSLIDVVHVHPIVFEYQVCIVPGSTAAGPGLLC